MTPPLRLAEEVNGTSARTSTGLSPVAVLIVDDNAGKRLALRAVLTPLDYLIVEADSGVAALRCVAVQDFAVILLDVRMPIMNGVETAALIRQRQQSEMTPIIFVTAEKGDELVQVDRYAQGAVDFIVAPVSPDELRAKVSVFAGLFSRARDLAARARHVQATADQLRLLTDAAPVGIFQTDRAGRYVYTNPRWSQITGIAAGDAVGRPWQSMVGADQRAGLMADLAAAKLNRSEISLRLPMRRPDATTRIVLVTSHSIPDSNGATAGWVGTVADVTAEAGAEAAMSDARDEATEASRLKSDFLANMSHEIRTPMNGIIGMTDLLLETTLDSRQRDYAQTVRDSGEALLTIINDILDFSKVEAGKLEVEIVDFNLRNIVEDVVDLLAGPADAKGLELIAAVQSGIPPVVVGDPGRVRQVLTNLVGNALKFTQSGEIVVRVTRAGLPGDDPMTNDTVVRFEVSDTGDGIPPEKLDLIFAPFVQADTSTSRKYGGTGLGLAISSQLVALMGGDCGVTSEMGVGSTFWFTIRVGSVAGIEQPDKSSPDAGLAGINALIVSDRATQRTVLSDYLTRWGMTVRTAETGRSALATLRTAAAEGRPFAVALLDWSMTGMDGPELKNAIVVDPALTPRLVLLTAVGHERDLDNATRGGGCVSLPKPIHEEALRLCLRVALGLQEAPSAPIVETTGPPAPQGEFEGRRLLLAEDNLINQRVAVAMLSSVGYRVDTVLNGAAAVQAVASRSYDAVLMDCQMPELNGYEATAAIRALKSSGRMTPIIAMTAGARPEDRDRCLAEGMDAYVSKPVSKDALLALVDRSVRTGTAAATAAAAELVEAETVEAAGALAADSGADHAVTIDRAVFDDLRILGQAAGGDFLGDLVDQFVSDTEPLLLELRVALDEMDESAVRRIAHTLIGSSSQLGGRRFALALRRLDERAGAGLLADGDTDLQEVERAYQDLCRMLIRQLAPVDRQPSRGPRV
jgi:PAS domain S-box-containing protein